MNHESALLDIDTKTISFSFEDRFYKIKKIDTNLKSCSKYLILIYPKTTKLYKNLYKTGFIFVYRNIKVNTE